MASDNRRSVFTETSIVCKALAAQIEAFCAVPARSPEASWRLDRYSTEPRAEGPPIPPDHDHFNGSVNLDDAGPVMREIAWPMLVGLRRIPDRETGG
jgi:hypothetical protein